MNTKARFLSAIIFFFASGSVFAGLFGSIIGGAVGGAVGKEAGKAVAKPNIQTVLTQAVEKVNANGPVMVDSDTRMDRASSGPGPLFTYHNTLTTIRAADVNQTAFQGTFANGLRSRVCANPGMTGIFKIGVTVAYEYQGNDRQLIGIVKTTPKDCGF